MFNIYLPVKIPHGLFSEAILEHGKSPFHLRFLPDQIAAHNVTRIVGWECLLVIAQNDEIWVAELRVRRIAGSHIDTLLLERLI